MGSHLLPLAALWLSSLGQDQNLIRSQIDILSWQGSSSYVWTDGREVGTNPSPSFSFSAIASTFSSLSVGPGCSRVLSEMDTIDKVQSTLPRTVSQVVRIVCILTKLPREPMSLLPFLLDMPCLSSLIHCGGREE